MVEHVGNPPTPLGCRPSVLVLSLMPLEMEGDAGAAPACAVLRTAGWLITQSPVVDRKGLAPLMEPMALRLKRPNRSLLREPIRENGAASGSRAPFPSLATRYSAVKLMLRFLHATLGLRACRPPLWRWARWVTTGGLGPRIRRESGRLCGCCPRSCALKGRRPSCWSNRRYARPASPFDAHPGAPRVYHRKRTYTVAPLGLLRIGWPQDFVRTLAD